MTSSDETCVTDSCADGSTGTPQCAPTRLPSCDVAGDPLRALGVACYEGFTDATLVSPDPDAWRTPHEFGNAYWVSADNDAILAITTGRLPAAGPTGSVVLDPGAGQPGSTNGNPDGVDAPSPVDVTPGSNGGAGGTPFLDCDGVGDCSDTLQGAWAPAVAHDLLWLVLDADVPPGTRGYSVRAAVLSAEFPERIGDASSDTLVWWSASEAYTGNLATLGSSPATVATLTPHLAYEGEHPALLRTGMDGVQPACTVGSEVFDPCPTGAATSWLELRGPVAPGETLSIAIALFDHGDDLTDTTVLLDGWQWQCDGCTLGLDCGLRTP